MDYPDYQVVFVDNASDDDSLELARKLAADSNTPCRFLQMDENVGFCRAKNAGAEAAAGKYVWLLDNDIEPDRDCLSRLVAFMETHPETALCGPMQFDFDRRDRCAGGGMIMGYLLPPRPCREGLPAEGHRSVSFISGGVMFVRRSVWRALGGFEPTAEFFLDDNDYGPRCWLAGHKVALVGGPTVRHMLRSRAPHSQWRWRFRRFAPGSARGIIRNYSGPGLLVALPAFVTFYVLKALKASVWRLDPRILLDCARGLAETIRGLPESFRQRRRTQKPRTAPGDPFIRPQ